MSSNCCGSQAWRSRGPGLRGATGGARVNTGKVCDINVVILIVFFFFSIIENLQQFYQMCYIQ